MKKTSTSSDIPPKSAGAKLLTKAVTPMKGVTLPASPTRKTYDDLRPAVSPAKTTQLKPKEVVLKKFYDSDKDIMAIYVFNSFKINLMMDKLIPPNPKVSKCKFSTYMSFNYN